MQAPQTTINTTQTIAQCTPPQGPTATHAANLPTRTQSHMPFPQATNPSHKQTHLPANTQSPTTLGQTHTTRPSPHPPSTSGPTLLHNTPLPAQHTLSQPPQHTKKSTQHHSVLPSYRYAALKAHGNHTPQATTSILPKTWQPHKGESQHCHTALM